MEADAHFGRCLADGGGGRLRLDGAAGDRRRFGRCEVWRGRAHKHAPCCALCCTWTRAWRLPAVPWRHAASAPAPEPAHKLRAAPRRTLCKAACCVAHLRRPCWRRARRRPPPRALLQRAAPQAWARPWACAWACAWAGPRRTAAGGTVGTQPWHAQRGAAGRTRSAGGGLQLTSLKSSSSDLNAAPLTAAMAARAACQQQAEKREISVRAARSERWPCLHSA